MSIIPRFLVLLVALFGLQAPSFDAPAEANDGTLDLNYAKIDFGQDLDLTAANADLTAGFRHRYLSVATIDNTVVDALVVIRQVSHVAGWKLNTFDQYDNSGDFSFHTKIDVISNARTSALFRIVFLESGTDHPVVIRNLRAGIRDIDLVEFVEFKDISSHRFSSPHTEMYDSGTPLFGGDRWTQFLSKKEGKDNDDPTRNVEVNYDAVSAFDFMGGCRANAYNNGLGTNGRCGFTLTIGTTLLSSAATTDGPAEAQYVLTYDSNAGTTGTAPAPETASGLRTIDANSGNLSQGDLEFHSWNTSKDGTGFSLDPGAPFVLWANTTLYAQYAVVKTVTFVANGGTGSMSPQVSATRENLTSNVFQYSGYTFSGWNTQADGSGTDVIDGSNYDFAENMTIYAQWAPIVASPPTDPSPPADSPPAESSPPPYSPPAESSPPPYSPPADSSPPSYSPPADSSPPSYSPPASPTNPVSNVFPYTVNYVANGGDGLMEDQVSSSPLTFTSNGFAREGWDFLGWNTSADGSGISFDQQHLYHFESDLTLYAQWVEAPVPVIESVTDEPTVLADTGDGIGAGVLSLAAALMIVFGVLLITVRRNRQRAS